LLDSSTCCFTSKAKCKKNTNMHISMCSNQLQFDIYSYSLQNNTKWRSKVRKICKFLWIYFINMTNNTICSWNIQGRNKNFVVMFHFQKNKEMHMCIPPMFWCMGLGGSKQNDVQSGLQKTFRLSGIVSSRSNNIG
jgi:hypothetical protein